MITSQLRDAIVRLNPDVIDGFDVDAMVEEIVATVNTVEGGLVRVNEQVLHILRGTAGVVVDYIGLAEEVQRAVAVPTAAESDQGGGVRYRRVRAGRRVPHHLCLHRRPAR